MAATTEQSEDLEPLDQANTIFGRYHVRRKIGEGAMARVFEAYDPATDRRIALKVLKPSLRSDETLVSRFMNEARAAGGLSHPHIVACYDVDITDVAPYITMELLEGPSLEELLAEGSSTNLALTVEYLCQIALALDHAHQAGRIHRDIKPSNILLTPDLKIAKIADFGVARIEQTDLTAATSLGEFIGTPRYTSPEQLDGGMIDGRSDLFSFGAVAYEMLTRRKAFDATTMSTLIAQITNETPSRIRDTQPDVPPAIALAVEKLLAKSPNDRWQTGAAFIDALQQPTAEDGGRKRRSLSFWLAGGLLTIGGIAIVLIVQSTDTKDEPAAELEIDAPVVEVNEPEPTPSPFSDLRALSDIEPSAPPSYVPPSPIWPDNWQQSWLRLAANQHSGDCYWLEYDGSSRSPGLKGVTDNAALRQQMLAELHMIQGSGDVVVELMSSDSAICGLAIALAGQAVPAPRRMIEITPPNHRIREGEAFELSIAPPVGAAQVALFHIDSEGMVNQLYEADARSWKLSMNEGRIMLESGSEDGLWAVYPPFGTEVLFALATNGDRPFSVSGPLPFSAFLDQLSIALASEGDVWHLASLLQLETAPR